MFPHISSHLTDAAVPDRSRDPMWFQSVTNSCGTLSLGANIKQGHDLPVNVRSASIFVTWLLGRDVWYLSWPWKGCSTYECFLPGLLSWGSQSPLAAPKFTSRTACSGWDNAGVPQNLCLQGLRIRLYYRECFHHFLRISYISRSNKTVKSGTIHKELDN